MTASVIARREQTLHRLESTAADLPKEQSSSNGRDSRLSFFPERSRNQSLNNRASNPTLTRSHPPTTMPGGFLLLYAVSATCCFCSWMLTDFGGFRGDRVLQSVNQALRGSLHIHTPGTCPSVKRLPTPLLLLLFPSSHHPPDPSADRETGLGLRFSPLEAPCF